MAIGRNAVRQSLPGSNEALYTVPDRYRFEIRSITGVNRSSGADADWFLYLVPYGDSAGIENVLIPGTTQWDIPAGKSIDYETWKVLNPGDAIWGYSTGDVTIHIDGALVPREY